MLFLKDNEKSLVEITTKKKGEHCGVKSFPLVPTSEGNFVCTERTFCLKYWQLTKICRSQDSLEICASKVVDGFSMMNGFEREIALICTYQDFKYHNNNLQKLFNLTVNTIGVLSITPFLRVIMRIIIASVKKYA